jgi:hypothetical protein
MLTPLLISFGILAILVYKLYGGPQDKDRLQVFLSAVVCTWFSIGHFANPDSPRVVTKVVEFAAPVSVPIVTSRTHHDDTAKIDPSLIHSSESSLDCEAPIMPAEMHSPGCNGGCVGYSSAPSNVCSYTGAHECIGTVKQKIRRAVATIYHPLHTSYVVVDDDGRKPDFRWPVRGRIVKTFSDGGDGINIAIPVGTEVRAVEDGVVSFAGAELAGYGNLILIRHPSGFVTAYAHNSELTVARGDKVTRGQTIAKSGQTGQVASPQLHFELRKGSTPVDPTLYLAGI